MHFLSYKRKKIILNLFLSILLLISFLVSTNASAVGVIRIGVLLPLTGPIARTGISSLSGIELAVREINERGGISAIGKLKLIILDTAFDPSKSVSAFNRLVHREKVHATIAGLSYSVTKAIMPLAERNKIPLISPSLYYIRPEGSSFFFNTALNPRILLNTLSKFVIQDLRIEEFILIGPSYKYSISNLETFENIIKSSGKTVVTKEIYSPGDKFALGLDRFSRNRTMAILYTGTSRDIRQLLKNTRGLARRTIILGIGPIPEVRYLESDSSIDQRIIFATETISEKFISKIITMKEAVDATIAAHGFDAISLLAHAIREANAIGSDRIRQALLSIKDFNGVTGRISFDMNGDVIKPVLITEFKRNRFENIKTLNAVPD